MLPRVAAICLWLRLAAGRPIRQRANNTTTRRLVNSHGMLLAWHAGGHDNVTNKWRMQCKMELDFSISI
jgi:hypothetical protein